MSTKSATPISEWFIRPLQNLLPPEANQPIHFTPFDLRLLNVNYTQNGLLFAKPPPPENQHFSISAFLDDLRRSLSATLTHFYPLAGRFATRKQQNPPSYVIYLDPANGPGVKFIYAMAEVTVSDIVKPVYVPLVVRSFFDLNNAINHDGHMLPLLSIQVTELIDGIFIGGSVNHMVADGTSFWHFMALWSEIFNSKEQYRCRSISRPPVIKQLVMDGFDPIFNLPYAHHDQFIERYEFEAPLFKERFFHFSSVSVSKLKAKSNSECNVDKISSLQAVIGLLWRCITRVRRLPHDTETTCRLMINNRRRLNPPLSDDYFGNMVQTVSGIATAGELMAHGLGWAALRLHEAVVNHDDRAIREYVESWTKNPFIIKFSQLEVPNSNLHVGNSPRFDIYGCEFGLGKAVAARSGCVNKGDGKITMYPGLEGGGSMDVEVCLVSSRHMMDLECDQELLDALKID